MDDKEQEPLFSSSIMLNNHFKIAFRNLIKHKGFSLINMFGLVVGMTACLLLINYVTFELSFDDFHHESENIYRVTHEFFQDGELQSQSAAAYSPLAPLIKDEIPEILSLTRIHPTSGTILHDDGKTQQSFNEEHIYFTDSSFFEVFSFPKSRDSHHWLREINTAIITKSVAIKYFGNQVNPVGRTLHWHNGSLQTTFTISAVVEDLPSNSHLDVDFLFSFATLERLEAGSMIPLEENWGWPGFYTYLKVKPITNVEALEEKINWVINKRIGEELKSRKASIEFYLQPLTDIHLYSHFQDELSANGSITTIQFVMIIGLSVLLIAYINYLNLSTVRSLERAKEVGIRKVMGSQQHQLVGQFMMEFILLNAMALLLSLLLYYLVLPFAYLFTGFSLENVLWTNPYIFLILLFLILIGPILSSLYPALVLSGYQPVTVLKGNFRSSSQGLVLRKGLVILQYIASIVMVAGTLIVMEQVQYMRNKELGVILDQMLIVHGPKLNSPEETARDRIEVFKEDVLQLPGIRQVSTSSAVPGTQVKNVMMYKRVAEEWEDGHTLSTMKIDASYVDIYQAEILAGRKFSSSFPRDVKGETLLINEVAVYRLGYDNFDEALYQKIVSANGDEREIVGVLKNYHQSSVAQDIEPLLFVVDTSEPAYISIKLEGEALKDYSDIQVLLQEVESAYKQSYQGDAFDYFFLDNFFDQQYQSEVKFSRLFTFFSFLAIVVASLGLFGLASYTALQRTKEIGIRKVLGASVSSLLLLLSRDYIKLILIAFLIAIPIANYCITEWLQNFAYRIDVHWWLFAIPGIVVLLIAAFSVSSQTFKAARKNPVDSLRYE